MKYPRLAIPAMAAAHLLLFILLVLWEPWKYSSLWFFVFSIAIFMSQGFLLGLWAALGGTPTPWRASFVVIVAGTWGWFMHYRTLTLGPATIILTGQTLQAMGVLLLARFLGLGLKKSNEGHVGHLQFSIGQALSWMTVLTVFMGATHYMKDSFHEYYDERVIRLISSCLAVGLAAMWLTCGNKWIILRLLALLLLIGLGVMWMLRGNQILSWWEAATLLACEAVVTAASLLVVRLAGYRLTWHWPFRRPKA